MNPVAFRTQVQRRPCRSEEDTVSNPSPAVPPAGELLDQLDAVYRNACRVVAGVRADQWELATPCSEWNVRQLVEHVGATTRLMRASAARSEPTAGGAQEHLGDDPAAAFGDLAAATMAAWRADGALDGMVQVPGEMPAEAALSINLLDVGIHTWDLATATGQEHGLTADQIATIDAIDRRTITDEVRDHAGFGDALDAERDDSLATMLAFVGRRA